MSRFLYACEMTGKVILPGDEVRVYHLDGGAVVEEMRGFFNDYDSIDIDTKTFHQVRGWDGIMADVELDIESMDSVAFKSGTSVHTGLNDVRNVHFLDTNDNCGVAVVLECDVPFKYIPSKISNTVLKKVFASGT